MPRRSRVGVSVVFAVCGAAFATWAARVPAVAQRLDLADGELAVGLFGLAAGSVLALVAAGPVIAAIGSRTSATVGATILCVGLPLIAFAPGRITFVGALVVLGIGNSLLDVSMNAHASRVEQAYDRPIFAGFHAYWNAGGLTGSALAAVAAAFEIPTSVHFSVAAAVLLPAALWATRRFLPGPDQGQGVSAFALPGGALIPLGAIAFCAFLVEGTVNDWSAVLIAGTADPAAPTQAAPSSPAPTSQAAASLGYFAFSLTMIAVRLVADRLVGRVGTVALTRAATVVTVVGIGLVTVATRPAVAIVGFGVIGLGLAAIVPLAWRSAGRQHPDAPGRAIAAVATCGYLGFLAGPVLIGALAGLIGLQLAVGAAGIIVVAVLFLAPALGSPARGTRCRV